MMIEDILKGESENIEFKESLPVKSIKYMKSVVAFSNGRGGKIIFGIQDDTNKIIGIPTEEVFKTMDAIINAISDSCEPMIIPDIGVQEVDGKMLIIVDVAPGRQRPYYIKSMGIKDGTYIRSGGTSRPAEQYKIRELMLEGSNRCFDQLPAEGQTVTDDEITTLCEEMTAYAKKRLRSYEERDKVRLLTKNQLLSWELLVEKNGMILPTNGFCLLAGKKIPSIMASVQCAVFKGNNRAVFVDRKTYDGAIYHQIDKAYDFVLRMIRMGAKIDGIVRQDIYEFPIGTVREMISNAICHRSYLEPANVQVAIYDDRLEVTSPGMLSSEVTLEKIREGYSKIRNRGIASAFVYMNIIETWGSGIPRMIQECKEYGLEEPELIDAEGDFRINLYRKDPIDKMLSKAVKPSVEALDEVLNGALEKKLKLLLQNNPQLKQNEIVLQLGISRTIVQRITKELLGRGEIERKGSNRNGYWIVND